ncbi:MAG: hypothetical protein KJZ98_14475 [Burkholderiaceae bacterium]|nr:hypothetical protein [Burkholderiaceae bacterium]
MIADAGRTPAWGAAAGHAAARGAPVRSAAHRAATCRAVATALALSLAGCSVSIGIGIGVDEDALLDTGNAAAAAATGFDTVLSLAGPGLGIADDPLRVASGERPRRALAPGSFDWLEIAAPLRAGALQVSGGRYASQQTLGCESGSVQLRAVFANGVAFAAGDTIELDAAGCRFGGVRFDGALAITVVSASGYPGTSAAWGARVSIDYAGWRIETAALPSQARSMSGRAVLDGQRFDALNAEVRFDSAALTIDPVVSGAGRPRRSIETLGLRLVDGPADDVVEIDFDLADAPFAGADLARLRVRSHGVLALPGPMPAYPLGILLVSAPDHSAVYANAIDAMRIRLELDRYLDGLIDATLSTSWNALRAL